MKTLFSFYQLSVIFMLTVLFTNCTSPASVEPVDITEEIQALNEVFGEAFSNGDAAAVAARYTTDGKLYPPNSEMMEGQKAIEAYWQGAMDAGLTGAKLETLSATAYGDVAYEIGKVDIFAGEQVVDKAKFIVIWKKVEGEWKMHEDIWNSSMPLPTPPAEAPAEEMEE